VPAGGLDRSPTSTAKQGTTKTLVSPWIWMVIACMLLGISGGIRFWRDRQFQSLAEESASCPFPLSEFPETLGTWHVIDGSDSQLDPEIARVAGSSDHIIRTYQDAKSAQAVKVLILYGPANSVFAHTPELCYPAAGYEPVDPPTEHTFSTAGSQTPVRFRSAFFSKHVGGRGEYDEVYYTFLHNGQWLPEVESRWKFRYQPGMFKVQLERLVSGLSKDTENSPTESLLREIVQEIEHRRTIKSRITERQVNSSRPPA
jgi:Protein of unknown function (DUF3485)